MRLTGKISFWHDERAYGFIKPDHGSDDVFVHVTALPHESILNVVDKVSFEIEDDSRSRGPKAANAELASASRRAQPRRGAEARVFSSKRREGGGAVSLNTAALSFPELKDD